MLQGALRESPLVSVWYQHQLTWISLQYRDQKHHDFKKGEHSVLPSFYFCSSIGSNCES